MNYREQDKDALITKLREEVSFLTSKNNDLVIQPPRPNQIRNVKLYIVAIVLVFVSSAMGVLTFMFILAQGLARHTNGKAILTTILCLVCTVAVMKIAYWLNDKSRS